MSRPPGRSRDHSLPGLQIVQSDLSMNMFISLLVLLSVLSLASSLVATEGFKVSYKAEHPDDRVLGLVRSWRPILLVNPHILVRNGRAYRLDMRQLAIAVAEGRSLVRDERFDDSTRLLDGDPDPSAFRIFLYLYGDGFPEELVAYSFDLSAIAPDVAGEVSLPEPLAGEIAEAASFDIFFAHAEAASVWPLAKLFHDARVPIRLLPLERAGAFAFERATSRFAFEDVYK